MDHYLDIRLLPDPEFVPQLLMNALFAKLHRGLVDLNTNAIGVSFPEVQAAPPALGGRLRLHGTDGDLRNLMNLQWLKGMRDHTVIEGPQPVPDRLQGHRVVRRVQAKSNPERIRRRLIKRKQIDQETARQAIPDSAAERLQLPYLALKSRSTGHEFRLYVDHQPLVPNQVRGSFNHYGLSPSSTVPWF